MKLRIVKASQGLHWVLQGLRTSQRQPFNLVGLLGMVACLALLLMGLPVVGPLMVVACMPLLWMGFMLATRRVIDGERITPSVMIEAVRTPEHPRIAFAKLGGAYVGATLLVMLLAQWMGPGAEVLGEAIDTAKASSDVLNNPLVQQDMLWRMGLTIPVSLAFWHTPALVLWARLPVGKALFFSVVAAWRNLGAFVVYGLVWLALVITLAVIDRLVMSALGDSMVVNVLAVSAGMWLTSAFYASLYFTVVDCFDAPDQRDMPQDTERVTPSNEQA